MRRLVHMLAGLSVLALLTGCPAEGYLPEDETDGGTAGDTSQFDTSSSDAGLDGDTANSTRDAGDTTPGDTRTDCADDEVYDPVAGECVPADAGGDRDTGSNTCVPDHDGEITRDEVILRPGLTAIFESAKDVTVDTAGTTNEEGQRVWDLTGPYEGDTSTLVELMALDGKWYREEFPDATYASKLADGEDEIGVFKATDDKLLLRGVVTPDDGFSRTELEYEPGATILDFPLTESSSWTSESDVSGWYLGGWWTATEEYQSQVDARGIVETPYGDFDALRVRTTLTRTVGLSVTTIRTFSFVTECFGTVATITSTDNEDDVEFTEAAEIRRLSR